MSTLQAVGGAVKERAHSERVVKGGKEVQYADPVVRDGFSQEGALEQRPDGVRGPAVRGTAHAPAGFPPSLPF